MLSSFIFSLYYHTNISIHITLRTPYNLPDRCCYCCRSSIKTPPSATLVHLCLETVTFLPSVLDRPFPQALVVPMFDLFSTTSVRSTSSHNRSNSTPQLQGLTSIAKPQWYSSHAVTDNLSVPTASAHSCSSQKPSPALNGDSLTTPGQIRQRNFSPERGRSIRHELPPLVTLSRGQEHDLHFDPLLASVQNSDRFPSSPLQSRQSSPNKIGGKLADWFNGESDPLTFSILPSPIKETSNPLEIMPTLAASQTSLVQKNSAQGTPKPSMASRFSFFTPKAPSPRTSHQAVASDDEFLDLDVHNALFPTGPADPFSPAAFKNLVQNAEGLLSRLQTAYKERTQSLRDITIENETQAEELDGVETRAKLLKSQLDDMAIKLAEQDDAMMNLVDDLAREKQLRREEEDARKRSVTLVKASREAHAERSQRESRGSINSDWSSGSGEDSAAESVFSYRHGSVSPTMSMSSISTTNSPESQLTLDFQPMAALRLGPSPQPIFRATTGSKRGTGTETASCQEKTRSLECASCHGLTTNEAWNVVGVLKEENSALKARVEQMEGALDGCLDVVDMLR